MISRVFLDYWTGNTGAFRLDDLEIKRSAPPSIACDTVVRGEVTTCEINRTVDSVLEWKFTGPLEHWLFSPDTVTVTDSTPSTTWTGTAVLSGDVSVRLTMEGGADTVALTGKLAVEDRHGRGERRTGRGRIPRARHCARATTVHSTVRVARASR